MNTKHKRILVSTAAITTGCVLQGCGTIVAESLLGGVRDGSIDAASTLVTTFFADQFGLGENEVGDEHTEEDTHGGNDRYIGL